MFAVSSPARVAIGACIPPASFARRTSRDGRLARLCTRVGADRPVAEDGARDRDDAVRPRRVDDRLRGRRLVVAERDRGRAGEQRAERVADRVLGGDPHEPVLDDAVGHVLLAEGAADLRDLLHGEAAVFRDDQRPAAGEYLLAARRPTRAWPPSAWSTSASARSRRAAVGGRRWKRRRPCDGACSACLICRGAGPPLRRWALVLPRRAGRRPRSSIARSTDPVRPIEPRPSRSPGASRSAGAGCLWRFRRSSVVATRRVWARPSPRMVAAAAAGAARRGQAATRLPPPRGPAAGRPGCRGPSCWRSSGP